MPKSPIDNHKTAQSAVLHAHHWSVLPETVFTERYSCTYNGIQSTDTFSSEDLQMVHPHLPELLDAVSGQILYGLRPSGGLVRNSYLFWESTVFVFPREAFNTHHAGILSQDFTRLYTGESLYVGDVMTLQRVSAETVAMGGTIFALSSASLPSGAFYCTERKPCVMYMHAAWLDAHCPGWENQMGTAAVLDMPWRECIGACLAPFHVGVDKTPVEAAVQPATDLPNDMNRHATEDGP